MRIAIFASGTGTNFANLIKQDDINADFCLLVCDKKGAKCIDIAKDNNIDTLVVSPKEYNSKTEFEQVIIDRLDKENIDLLVLAGYMRILTKEFVQKFENKIINIHPSYLPHYKGATAIKDAFLDGKDFYGVTVHYVNEEVDGGDNERGRRKHAGRK